MTAKKRFIGWLKMRMRNPTLDDEFVYVGVSMDGDDFILERSGGDPSEHIVHPNWKDMLVKEAALVWRDLQSKGSSGPHRTIPKDSIC